MPGTLDVVAIISVIVVGVVLVVELFVMTALLLAVKALVVEIRDRIDPLVTKTGALLTTANQMAESVQGHTEHLGRQAVQTTGVVGDQIETASRAVQRAVAVPVIHGSAAMAGVRRGLSIWSALRRQRQRRDASAE